MKNIPASVFWFEKNINNKNSSWRNTTVEIGRVFSAHLYEIGNVLETFTTVFARAAGLATGSCVLFIQF